MDRFKAVHGEDSNDFYSAQCTHSTMHRATVTVSLDFYG
jgi:hypothetical protein